MSDVNKELDALQKQEELRATAKWFKFTEPGQSFQGTLITRTRAQSQLNQDQIVYVLKNDEGVWNVAFSVTHNPIHRELANAVVGQVVRFSYLEDKPHRVKGYNPIKIIRVFTRPDLVDQDATKWLADYGLTIGEPLPSVLELPEDVVGEEEEEEQETAQPLGKPFPGSK